MALLLALGHAGGHGGASAKKPKRLAVVVSPANPVRSLTVEELKRLFLRQSVKWPNGWPVTVYDRHTEDPIREQFSTLVLGKKPKDLREYWLKLRVTKGYKPPVTCRSTRLLKRYLARVKGGVGYLYEDEVDDTVKVVALLEVKPS